MIYYPNAKINLGLQVLSKRADGYHNLSSIFMPVEWSDILEVLEDSQSEGEINFYQTGIKLPGPQSNNLIVKAYNLLRQNRKMPSLYVHLHKILPFGAGLGGGSSDAAFFIKALSNQFTGLINENELSQILLQLGSDCPFFMLNQTCIAEGRGEILDKIDLPLSGIHYLIVFPEVHVSTAQAFSLVKPDPHQLSLKELIKQPIGEWRNLISNNFEESVFKIYPLLAEIKDVFYQKGAFYASLSGSGSALYGFFESEPVDFNFKNYKFFKGVFK